MKSLWISADADGNSWIAPLALPLKTVSRPMDAEVFRRQARGEEAWRPPRLLSSAGLAAMRVIGDRQDPYAPADDRQLMFVVSGRVEVIASDGSSGVLGPGDALLAEDLAGKGHRLTWKGDCRVLRLSGLAPWRPDGVAVTEGGPRRRTGEQPLLRRMYKGTDDRSYFRRFDQLFPDADGVWSSVKPVVGFSFTHFPPGFFIDWHPEVVNNFVIVMTGELELEVGGDGSIEVFGPGDVCLAEDRTGEGHVDRMHGDNRIAVIVLEDEHLWP